MTGDLAWQLAVNGLEAGGTYALLASGLVLAHRATGQPHLAHPYIAMLGAFAFAALGGPLGVGPAAAVAIAGAAVVTLLLHVAVFDRVRARPLSTRVTVALAVGLGLQVVGGVVYVSTDLLGARPSLFPESSRLGLGAGATMTAQAAALPVVALVATVGLATLLSRTDVGIALRAASSNPLAAHLAGVRVRSIERATWTLVGGLAGLVGVLAVSSTAFLVPTFLFGEAIRAFVAAAVGRFANLGAAVAASFAIGIAEQLLVGVAAPWDRFAGVVALAVLLVGAAGRNRGRELAWGVR